MRLLVLGGSQFVGRAVVASAHERGWRVTVMNHDRAGCSPDTFEHLHADRNRLDEVAQALRGRAWDFVVDTWQGPARAVAQSCELLQASCARYCYVSSVAVYRHSATAPLTEEHPRLAGREATADSYAARKFAAEHAVESVFGDRALLVRPGLIVGPWEYVGRLPWWLTRMGSRERVVCPEPRERSVLWVDSRDMADWIVHCGVSGATGSFNLVCPPGWITMESLLTACRRISGGRAKLCWASESTLRQAGIHPWTEMPLWIPPDADAATAYEIDASRAARTGAQFRPAANTIEDVWRWMTTLGPVALARFLRGRPWLTREKEERVLARHFQLT
jgi:nucleoside-diphosphate-sugar epimerase